MTFREKAFFLHGMMHGTNDKFDPYFLRSLGEAFNALDVSPTNETMAATLPEILEELNSKKHCHELDKIIAVTKKVARGESQDA